MNSRSRTRSLTLHGRILVRHTRQHYVCTVAPCLNAQYDVEALVRGVVVNGRRDGSADFSRRRCRDTFEVPRGH